MAGVYIHIPFCLKICGYCDFYRITGTSLARGFITSLIDEMLLRMDYLGGEPVDTIYFGGGTPSVLSPAEIGRLTDAIYGNFPVSASPEITIEANPDDIDKDYLSGLQKTSVNRISLGVQSWSDKYLRMLNRRHNAGKAEEAVKASIDAGFDNLSVDLIYGLPGMTQGEWAAALDKTFSFPIMHLSAYHLSFEKGTPFYRMLSEGLIREADEEDSSQQFSMLIEKARENSFIHYEISNYCREGFHSRHNTAYWKQAPYLGLGPSAHSFNGYSRQWNISDVKKYISSIKKGRLLYESEEIDFRKRFNEYIMTSLRTMWGIDLSYVEEVFEKEGFDYINNLSGKFLSYGMMRQERNSLILTDQGVMIADNIISEFMMA